MWCSKLFPRIALLTALSIAIVSAENPAPPGPSPTAKWLADVDPQWQTAFNREVQDPFAEAASAVKKKHLASLDALLAAVAKEGRLDDALTIRAERSRVIAGTPTTSLEDAVALPAIRALRENSAKSLTALEADRATRAKALHTRYDTFLAQSQVALTQRQRPEEALEIKARRDQLRAQWLEAPSSQSPLIAAQPAVVAVPGAVTSPPQVPVVPAPATSPPVAAPLATAAMDLYLSGSNGLTLYVNEKLVIKGVRRDKASKASVALQEGDVLIVCNADRWDINSFWMSCISSGGQFLFETTDKWTSYIPADESQWWIIEKPKSEGPAAFAPDKQEYVGLVKKAMLDTPLHHEVQPIRSTLRAAGRATYLHYTVTRADLQPKPEAVGAGK